MENDRDYSQLTLVLWLGGCFPVTGHPEVTNRQAELRASALTAEVESARFHRTIA